MAAWCKARCTGVDEAKTLRAAIDVGSFKLWDGYNLLPMLCAVDNEVQYMFACVYLCMLGCDRHVPL
eukprot:354762-Chlamydomonas_euryale.AAC.12